MHLNLFLQVSQTAIFTEISTQSYSFLIPRAARQINTPSQINDLQLTVMATTVQCMYL